MAAAATAGSLAGIAAGFLIGIGIASGADDCDRCWAVVATPFVFSVGGATLGASLAGPEPGPAFAGSVLGGVAGLVGGALVSRRAGAPGFVLTYAGLQGLVTGLTAGS